MAQTNKIPLHYLDGKWVKEEDAKISVFDVSLLRGYGGFEFLRTYNKKPFLLKEHIDRLYTTCELMSLQVPKSKEELIVIIHEGIAQSPFEEIGVKILVTGGVSPDGITPVHPSLIVLFIKAVTWPDEYASKGLKVQTSVYERYIPKAKSLNYMSAVVTLQKAKKEGFQEVIYISKEGNILEGTTVNFWAVMNGKLYTCEEDILFGCTRAFVQKLASELNIEVVIGNIHKDNIKSFAEAFITSTTREIHPVIAMDSVTIGDGTPGPITRKLMGAFNDAKALI